MQSQSEMEGSNATAATISTAARQCAEAFLQALSPTNNISQGAEGILIQDQLDRWKIWAGNLGVFARGNASADVRLRDEPGIKDLIMTLLRRLERATLNKTSTDGTRVGDEQQPDDSDSEESNLALSDETDSSSNDERETPFEDLNEHRLPEIEKIVTSLYKITALIKKPHSTRQEERVDNWWARTSWQQDEKELAELAKLARFIIGRRMARLGEGSNLLERLVSTVVYRRKRLLYLESHRLKLADGVDDFDAPPNPEPITETVGKVSATGEPTRQDQMRTVPRRRHGNTVALSETIASSVQKRAMSNYAKSVVLTAINPSNGANLAQLSVPAPPKPQASGAESICPYCNTPLHKSLTAGKESKLQWCRHVLRDIQPYICLFDDCKDPLRLYGTREDWIMHMSCQHASFWSCQAKDHNDFMFSTEADLISHLNDEHADSVTPEQMPLIVQSSLKPSPDVFANLTAGTQDNSWCPFCVDSSFKVDVPEGDVVKLYPEETQRKIQDHIAFHLEEFGLLSLPPGDEPASEQTDTITVGNLSHLGEFPELPSDDDTVTEEDYTPADPAPDVDPAEDWLYYLDTVGRRHDASYRMEDDKVLQRFFAAQEKQIYKWLASPDPSINFNTAKRMRHPQTGLWFLEMDHYKDWRNDPDRSLGIHGPSGCGKTILSSTIIEDLSESGSIPLYFFFSWADDNKRSVDGMVRSLLFQLYQRQNESRKYLYKLFTSCKDGKVQPSTEALFETFESMIEGNTNNVIVMDALDECETLEELLRWVFRRSGSSRFMLTSRWKSDIKAALRRFTPPAIVKDISAAEETSFDIRAYIHSRIAEDQELQRWRSRPDVCEEIETRLREVSDGSFRWVACQLDQLSRCHDLQKLKHALVSLPLTLAETYERILHNIPRPWYRKAIRLLQFLVFSERPLKLIEAVDAVAVSLEDDPAFRRENRISNPDEIIERCSSLVMVTSTEDSAGDKSTAELRLAHSSVKDYLLSERIHESFRPDFEPSFANATIAKVCVAYLFAASQEEGSEASKTTLPFTSFSAAYWMVHACIAEDGGIDLSQWVLKLLTNKRACTYWLRCSGPESPWNSSSAQFLPKDPLYYASLGGLLRTTKALLELGANPNAQSEGSISALHAAVARGHRRVVEMLLHHGADVNAAGGRYHSALQAASAGGAEEVLQLLLENGADVNAAGGRYHSALHVAATKGHTTVVQMLIERGADVNASGGRYGNALQAACAGGHLEVVRVLLHRGADANSQGSDGSPIEIATRAGHEQIVRLLRAYGADTKLHGHQGDHGGS